jgi:hypothetical protein
VVHLIYSLSRFYGFQKSFGATVYNSSTAPWFVMSNFPRGELVQTLLDGCEYLIKH